MSDQKLEQLIANFRSTFARKKDQLNNTFDILIDTDWSPDVLSELKHQVHKLSGSTGAYGFPELSRLIQSLEKEINQFKEGGIKDKDAIKQLFTKVIDQFDRDI